MPKTCELNPVEIVDAILFAIQNGWKPDILPISGKYEMGCSLKMWPLGDRQVTAEVSVK